ncbi:HIRAN domain-containing protein [Oceanospirillum maris]|uniref:HIRAN domain-containing protein n=1 Tax=Oceanospirillum maris TaxID=64977 RepID=UPI000416D682|nr:HIRAN domain-containing protein [Oceanospirillum maris]
MAKLTNADGTYQLGYTKGINSSPRFKPFARMQDTRKIYYSEDIFPFFKNRILPKNRPEFKKILRWLDLENQEFDPLVYLAISGGARITDSYMVVPLPEKENGKYKLKFLINGIRYIEEKVKKRIEKINKKQKLKYKIDESNIHDENAISLHIDDESNSKIGFCPRYLASDIKKLITLENDENAEFYIERVNLDAPYQYKILCSFSIKWPANFTPFVSEEYLPIHCK